MSDRLTGLCPIVRGDTCVVVLGSFPGAASLRAQQYYAHPRNQFWPIMAAVVGVDLVRMPYDERLGRLLDSGIGLWDVYAECARVGSLDSAIRAPVLNDLGGLVRTARGLRAFLHNGGESAKHGQGLASLGIPSVRLPSTSPANASWPIGRKVEAWRGALASFGGVGLGCHQQPASGPLPVVAPARRPG